MAKMRKKLGAALVSAAALSLALTACGGGGAESGGGGGGEGEVIDTSTASGDVNYWLWDANQLPAYQACADKFKAANANINIKITQYGWDDYWAKLTNSFIAGDAPDVFTDHLSKYPEFVSQQQLVALDETLTKDGYNVDQYQPGLADLWKGQDGKRYGLPKDFDTIAIFYNKKLVSDAGVKEGDLQNLQWNPNDGGTYEKTIAHLTVDESGKRGDEPGFDKSKVKVYGLGLDGGSGGGNGQTQWSMYTGSNNWQFTDKNPWGTHYNYDQPAFQQTIGWFRSLIEKGYMPSVEAVTGQGSSDIFAAGKYAMITNGSWQTNSFFDLKGVRSAWRLLRSARAVSGPACTTAWPIPSGSARRTSQQRPSGWSSSARRIARTSWVRRPSSSRRSRKRLRRPRRPGRPRESIPPHSPSRWTRRPPSCSRSPTMHLRSPES
jgi:multiple sugar transport system substrate-binding protein